MNFNALNNLYVKFVGEAGVNKSGVLAPVKYKEIACMHCRGQSGKLVVERNTQALKVIRKSVVFTS